MPLVIIKLGMISDNEQAVREISQLSALVYQIMKTFVGSQVGSPRIMEKFIESSCTGHGLGNRICEKIKGMTWSCEIDPVLDIKPGRLVTGIAVERRAMGG